MFKKLLSCPSLGLSLLTLSKLSLVLLVYVILGVGYGISNGWTHCFINIGVRLNANVDGLLVLSCKSHASLQICHQPYLLSLMLAKISIASSKSSL